jgi:excisionase family DNA binding protein
MNAGQWTAVMAAEDLPTQYLDLGFYQHPKRLIEVAPRLDRCEPHLAEGVVTVSDIADTFDICTKTVYRALREGELTGAKFGNRWRIRRAETERWWDTKVLPPRRTKPVKRRRSRVAATNRASFPELPN